MFETFIKKIIENWKPLMLVLISLGSFFYTLDVTLPYKYYTKRKAVVCEIVKHLGCDNEEGFIKIKHKSFEEIRSVTKSSYYQYEDGKRYYFNYSLRNMFPDEKLNSIIDKHIVIFSLITLFVVTISFVNVENDSEEYYGWSLIISCLVFLLYFLIII